ncbi:tetratricopeptide repeat protein [Micromonospora sp. WMMD1082]|uniref:tetratricopeptide repeat protein n=1 Tax=Micromonospora sp. WMMD1082 TaxID=3016104 RepID=UPI002416BF31|nr:tetratricopeptide repeat protein [Micromonospora sp. WMMD1082]MDG4798870.1 tetratricopeptide repeat protein [Micromonospora sp. WMMD1082]
MPSGFGELTDQAHDLVSAGDLAGAQRLLADALTGADPRPANATPEIAEAAGLHARVLLALGEPQSARGWAAYAYAASTRLLGRPDPRTVAAAATLAAVLHRVGSWSRAARLYQEVIIELTASDGPESLRVLAAHADLATVEYARGQCEVARDRLQDAWELHREVYGDGHPSGIKMLARLGSMQRDCGHFVEGHDNLALAGELARQHLAPDDPLTAQVAALARAAANPGHVCTDTPPVSTADPVVPAARTPPPDDAEHLAWTAPPDEQPTPPDAPRWAAPPDDELTPPPDAPRWAATPNGQPTPPPDAPGWAAIPDEEPARPGWPDLDDADQEWRTGYRAGREQHPAEGYHPSHGYQPAEHPSAGHPSAGHPPAGAAPAVPTPRQPADGPAGPPEDWWIGPPTEQLAEPDPRPEDPETGAAHQATGPEDQATGPEDQATDTAVPPSVIGLAGPPQAPGVYRMRRVTEPAQPETPSRMRRAAEPGTPSRLLPVPVRRAAVPPPRRSNRLVPIVAAGVLVVLLGAAAVIAGVSRVDGGGDPAPPAASGAPTAAPSDAATPTTTAPEVPPVSPGAAPSGLSLRDNRDSVTLRWTYPAGGEGPVIVSGGRTGQPQNAFADLPAGSDSFVVYGLNRSLDYCFTVAVAWSTDTIARSGEVCTERR